MSHFNLPFLSALIVLLAAITWTGCEKAITVQLPDQRPFLVLEGRIEPGAPPLVLISQSQDYFAPVDASSLGSLYAGGASVKLDVDGTEFDLLEVCTADLDPAELSVAAELLGISEEVILLSNVCVYTSFSILGEEGRTYAVEAVLGEDTARAVSKLNPPVPLDSVWFEIPGNTDSLGILHAVFEDPDSLGNAYRWSAKRLGIDPGFMYITVSTADDTFFNGLSFEFTAFRPVTSEDFEEGANPEEIGFYKTGDSVVVRWDHIDRGVYDAITSMEEQVQAQGSPFANPADVATNVEGGLGLWVAYSPYLDTVVCVP